MRASGAAGTAERSWYPPASPREVGPRQNAKVRAPMVRLACICALACLLAAGCGGKTRTVTVQASTPSTTQSAAPQATSGGNPLSGVCVLRWNIERTNAPARRQLLQVRRQNPNTNVTLFVVGKTGCLLDVALSSGQTRHYVLSLKQRRPRFRTGSRPSRGLSEPLAMQIGDGGGIFVP
jgi:hypothetical protein